MHTWSIDAFFSGHVFAFMLLLARLGCVIMLLPGFGETYVPPRTRMTFACLICFLLLEPMLNRLPPMPASVAEMARLVVFEAVIGIFFGTLVRLLLTALESAGMLVGMQTGLSSATMMNPALATQSQLPSAFLSVAGLVLIFVTGLDHFLIRTTVHLYDAFPAGSDIVTGDFAQTMIHVANKSFIVGIELAAPFLIVGLMMYAAMGIVQRLLPSIQLFLIMLPIQIWGGLTLLMLAVAGILTVWLEYFDKSIGTFFQG
ncbi:MAG: flagellar biosynthetic protein FliR [Alphaproteobacteria bacterium]|nr:flagellar biosynthetic protein FliR [Alphaproteobacteria bacterium]